MNYTKRIICLANSRKVSGRCIAGKEVLSDGHYGEWIRPISKRPLGEISEDERRFQNGGHPQVLDIVKIPLVRHQPQYYQQENHLIDDGYYWYKEGILSWSELAEMRDTPDTLWINGDPSQNGVNDRIPEHSANGLKNSLLLVQPDSLDISVNVEGAEFGGGKRKVRCRFTLNNHQYRLVVTDPRIESIYLKKEDGKYDDMDASKVYLCISIGEPFKGYCYKLVASIIDKNNSPA